MALGSTQPLTEMNTRCISWGKGGRCVRLTTLPPSRTAVMKSGDLNFLELSEPFQACNGTALPLPGGENFIVLGHITNLVSSQLVCSSRYFIILFTSGCDMIYLLTAVGLNHGDSRTVHIYTKTIHKTTQWNRIHRTEHS
jgi:hypothetical protein